MVITILLRFIFNRQEDTYSVLDMRDTNLILQVFTILATALVNSLIEVPPFASMIACSVVGKASEAVAVGSNISCGRHTSGSPVVRGIHQNGKQGHSKSANLAVGARFYFSVN